jgi:hypothetical protein
VLLDVIVTVQVEPFAHAFNVPLRKERENVPLKARRIRHSASQVLDYKDVGGGSGSTLLVWAKDVVLVDIAIVSFLLRPMAEPLLRRIAILAAGIGRAYHTPNS